MKAAVLHAPEPAADDRGRRAHQAAEPARCCCAPPSPGSATAICISSRGSTRIPTPCVLGHESRRRRRGGRRRRHLRQAGRPRRSPACRCSAAPARNASPATRTCARTPRSRLPPGVSRRMTWKGGELMNQFLNLSSFGEQMLVHENSMVKIDRRHPARPRGARRLRRDDRGGCGVQRRQGRARRHGRGDRLRRRRAVGGQWRGTRRRRAHHRDRHASPRSSRSRASSAPPTR